MPDAIRLEGMDRILKKVTTIQQLNGVKKGMKAAGLHYKGKIAKYPPAKRPSRASVYGETFVSDRQRRFFFAALRDGTIDVPYRRGISSSSETLGRRWVMRTKNRGLTVTVGNNASYAELVQGDKQSLYMETVGWKKYDEVLENEQGTMLKLVRLGLRKDIK